jgi:hypothetical protein
MSILYNTSNMQMRNILNGIFSPVGIPVQPVLLNGGFSPDLSYWTAGVEWSSDGAGKAQVSGAQVAETILEQGVGCLIGQVYRITGTVSSYSAGTLTPAIGGVDGTGLTANGAFTQDVTATTTGNLQFKADAAANLKLDDIKVVAI